ncbi:MAG: response regulator [Acidobacteriota bacterium]
MQVDTNTGAPRDLTPVSGTARGAVLVIDDEPAVCSMISRALSREGFVVTTAGNGMAGVEAVKSSKFEVAITDLKMPGMDGVETLAVLKEIDADLEVIVATGYATVETAIACMKHGAYDYIQKPLKLKEVGVLVERAQEKRHLQGIVDLYDWSRDLLAIKDHGDLTRLVLDMIARLLPADAYGLVLDPSGGERSQVHRSTSPCHPSVSFLRNLALHAMASGSPQCLSSPELQDLSRQDNSGDGFVSALVYPLVVRDASLGALTLLRRQARHPFTISEVRRGTVLAAQVAMALENAGLYEELGRKVRDLSAQSDRLAQLEARTRAILETALDGIITMDGAAIIWDLNPMAEKIFGRSRQEVIGLPLSKLIDPAQSHRSERDVLERFYATRGGPAINRRLDISVSTRGGHEIQIELSITAFQTPKGRMFSAFVRDTTKRATLETQLRHAQKLESIGQLAAGIAHEINTPTQYVGDNTRFLQDAFDGLIVLIKKLKELAEAGRRGPVSTELVSQLRAAMKDADVDYVTEEIPRAIEQSLHGVERVAQIVRAMKEFSHPGEEKTAFDINRGIQSTIMVARNEWKYVAEMVTELDPELPLVPCMPGDFNQVILNIIVNAAHAIADGKSDDSQDQGTITVSTRRVNSWAEIRIADTGGGIPENIRAKIFDPFFTTKDIGKGTGQGLSIAHAVIVKKHGGTISVETEMGKGTCFIIRLPLTEAADATDAPREEARP